ncbi:MAG TPA: hypothetical protein VKA74_08315 [Myxococcota bacterium]|nr:hypothetical protein [Myxococcota bacterium]
MKLYDETAAQVGARINNFQHHPPVHPQQARKYEANRDAFGALAGELSRRCPMSRELSLAHTKLEEAMFWANAAIARNETSEDYGGKL